MMWMSSVMDGNRQEEKLIVVKHKALKWTIANSLHLFVSMVGSRVWINVG
jgi:hypothetical protein